MRTRRVDPSRTAERRRASSLFGPVLRAQRAVRFAARRLTHADRALPDFVILGAQKSGTTSLYYYLQQHPRILSAFTKEVHYFTLHSDEPEAWYRAHFPKVGTLESRRALCGEATPYYLFEPRAAHRAKRTIPDARFICVLRDPVERAYSHYEHERARGRETLGFAAALEVESARIDPELARMDEDSEYTSAAHQNFSYFARGLYAEQLERWHGQFPAERFLILSAESLFQDPAAVCARVFDFLELPVCPLTGLRVFNQRGYAPLEPGLRAGLSARYAPHNRALAERFGTRYDWC